MRGFGRISLIVLFGFVLPLRSTAQNREESKGPDEDREARAEWFMSMRRGADGTIPPNALMVAKQQADAIPHPLSKREEAQDGGIWRWEWLGPGNIGGRIRSILIHPTSPNTMWIGGVSGGIWKTTDGGASWSHSNDFLPSLSVTSLAMDPTNPDVIYAATGEGFKGSSSQWPGAGVFKSTNGGTTWTQLPDTKDWAYTLRISHHPTQSGVLLAAVKNDYVYRTGDGGQTWTPVSSVTRAWSDVKFNPNDGSEALAANLTGGVFHSTNSGQSFVDIPCSPNKLCPYGRVEVAFGPGGYRYAAGEGNGGEVYRSTDGGTIWELRNTGLNYMGDAGYYLNMLWVDPTNGENVLVGGFDIYRSIDGANSFTKISRWQDYHTGHSAHGDQHFAAARPGFGSTNHTVYFANDGGIQMAADVTTVDSLSGWTNLAHGLGITQFYGGAITSDGAFMTGGTQDNSVVTRTGAAGTSGWTQRFTGDGGFAAIDPVNPNIQYGETQYGHPVKTLDGGLTYDNAFTGLVDTNSTTAPFITPLVMDPNNRQRLLLGATHVWETVNGADDWKVFKDGLATYGYPFVSALAVAPGNSNVVWVGYEDGLVYRTLDGGGSWERVAGTSSIATVTDITIDPSNINNVWVSSGGYKKGNILYTDSGLTPGTIYLSTRSGTAPYEIPAVHVATVQVHPGNSDWVYAGTDIGVFASDDRGLTWNRDPYFSAPNNDGPAYTQVAELFWQGDYLVAATHGRGMFRVRPAYAVYVVSTAPGGGDGSFLYPFNQLSQAAQTVSNGSILIVKNGTYASPVLLDKQVSFVANGTPIVVQ